MSSLDVTAARSRRRRRCRWREAGSSTTGWDAEMLGWSVCAVGAGALAAHLAPAVFPVETAAAAARVLVWLSMAFPVALAFSRSRPRGLLRFRAVDLLFGLVFGALLRLAGGVADAATRGSATWPSTFTTDGGLPQGFALEAVAGAGVTPALEELFFRGVVLVSLFTVLRRGSGATAAGVAAVALSTGLFVAAHTLTAPRDAAELIAVALLGVVAGAFVLGTGRIWPAVVVHVVFNASGFALLAVGTLLA